MQMGMNWSPSRGESRENCVVPSDFHNLSNMSLFGWLINAQVLGEGKGQRGGWTLASLLVRLNDGICSL